MAPFRPDKERPNKSALTAVLGPGTVESFETEYPLSATFFLHALSFKV